MLSLALVGSVAGSTCAQQPGTNPAHTEDTAAARYAKLKADPIPAEIARPPGFYVEDEDNARLPCPSPLTRPA